MKGIEVFADARFSVDVCTPISAAARVGDPDTEDEAVEMARAAVGANQTQVTIAASVPGCADTFAVRHFTWHGPHNGVNDSGWRVWTDGRFRSDLSHKRTVLTTAAV